jgi:hypothetical protein
MINEDNNTNTEFNIFQDQVREVLMALATKLEERVSDYETKLENIEKQIATLIIGFGEQAVFIDALIAQMSFSSKEAQEAFHDTVNDARKQMLAIMKEGADGLLGSSDPDLATAITSMADEQLSNSSEQ